MLDLKFIRENPEAVKKALENRNEPCTMTMHGKKIDLDEFLSWDKERRKVLTELETARARRNKISANQPTSQPANGIIQEMQSLKEKIKNLEGEGNNWEKKVDDFLLRIPNLPHPTVPIGSSPAENKVIREESSVFSFPSPVSNPRTHWEIGESLDILDFKRAAKISGTRFFLYKKQGATLERALINFMLDLHTGKRGDHLNGYQEIFAPYLVNRETMTGTGQLPKFASEMFACENENDQLYLVPTAEVSVTNLHRDEILEEKDLPLNYACYSACFRREAGSYGKDTKGLIRNHQFNKIELVKFVKPEDGDKELEKLLADAEKVLQKLGLTYRVVVLCTGDLGFAAAKTYDLEVWMPGEKKWREVSSCSNFTDFQARRMNIKFQRKTENGKRITEYVYTLNGSGLAVGRTFAAVLENYQQSDGTIKIPEVLQGYCGFAEIKLK